MSISTQSYDLPFITDIPLSKSSLARSMNVSRNSIKAWHKLAYLMIKPYREEFPLKDERNLLSRNQEVPFTPYQCWILGRVQWVMKIYRKYDLAKTYIKQNQHLFSFAKFISVMKGVA